MLIEVSIFLFVDCLIVSFVFMFYINEGIVYSNWN